jgi:SAM-dependent methyltransferase
MTEERRAQSAGDAAVKAAAASAGSASVSAAEPLDDADLEKDLERAPAANVPPVEARKALPSEAPRPDAASPSISPRSMTDSSPGHKKARARMTLRIPDDEISRPTPAVAVDGGTPSSPPAAASPKVSAPQGPAPPAVADEPMVALKPTRIITINPPSDAQAPLKPVPAPAKPLAQMAPTPHAPYAPHAPLTKEDSWTPYQPTAVDATRDAHAHASGASKIRPTARSEDMIPITSESDADIEGPPESGEPLDLDEAEAAAVLSSRPPSVATAAATAPIAVPRAARAPSVDARAVPPVRALAPTEPEGEEVRFDDDESNPNGSTMDRTSEPGEAAELSVEDMVSVESAPSAVQQQPKQGAASPAHPPKGLVQVKQASPPSSAGGPAIAGTGAAALPPMRPKAQSIPSMPPPAPLSKVTTPITTPAQTQRPPLVIVPPHAGVAPQSADASRRKARPWWEDLFNDDYIRTMAKITDDQIAAEADFIEDSLGVAKGGTMLDLACGTGRHAIDLARRGYEVVGFDLSLAMLARAADEAQEREQKLNFVQGDMREMTFDEAFDGVFSWNTSFGFFDEDTNAKVIGRVHKALKKGGQFMLDVANRDFIARFAPSLAWFEGDGCVCMDEMAIDWITSRMRVKRTLMMDDGRSKEIEYSIRIYALHELGRILHEQGFRVAEVSGRIGTPGVFFGGESPRTLILAEKR